MQIMADFETPFWGSGTHEIMDGTVSPSENCSTQYVSSRAHFPLLKQDYSWYLDKLKHQEEKTPAKLSSCVGLKSVPFFTSKRNGAS